jgi:hypothetical protein
VSEEDEHSEEENGTLDNTTKEKRKRGVTVINMRK